MALFTSRSSGRVGRSQAEPSDAAETIEAMRRRARHRLIGATVLVALGVVGFPLLFDTQPRPVAVDIPIEIPDRNKSAPVTLPAVATSAPSAAASPPSTVALAGAAASAAGAVAPGPVVSAQSSLGPREQLVGPVSRPVAPDKTASADKKSEPPAPSGSRSEPDQSLEAQKKVALAKPDRPVEDKPKDKTPARAQEKAVAKGSEKAPVASANQSDLPAATRDDLRIARAEEAARARALLQGKSVAEAAAIAEGRFIVQIGAFSEPELAQAARSKVERAGLRTYTQEAKTASGTHIRVRVGPFATRAEANEAASKIKGLSLPASILTL